MYNVINCIDSHSIIDKHNNIKMNNELGDLKNCFWVIKNSYCYVLFVITILKSFFNLVSGLTTGIII